LKADFFNIMARKIIVLGDSASGKSNLIKIIYQELRLLLRIHGYLIHKQIEGGQLKSLQISFFRNPETPLTMNPVDLITDDPGTLQYTERILEELSLFPSPDMFLIDDLGMEYLNFPRIGQQLRTIFLSRIPSIFTTTDADYQRIRNSINDIHIELIRINAHSGEDLYLNILKLIS